MFTRRFFVASDTPHGILVSLARHLGFLRGSTAIWWFSDTASLLGLTCFFLFLVLVANFLGGLETCAQGLRNSWSVTYSMRLCAYRSWLFLPLYCYNFYIYILSWYTHSTFFPVSVLFSTLCHTLIFLSFPLISMAASGNGNVPSVVEAIGSPEESDGLSVAHTPSQVDSISEM